MLSDFFQILCMHEQNTYIFSSPPISAMPYIDCCKFSDAVRTMDHVEVRAYMRNLFMALAHIHKIGIIHRK